MAVVFLGGGAGAACRYGLGRFIGERYRGWFPLGTFTINVTGCFALGLVASLFARVQGGGGLPQPLLTTGFLGGYTTFSTYAVEGVLLYNDGRWRIGLSSLIGSILAGLTAAAAGAWIARFL